MMGSFVGRGNQCIHLVKVLCCKLLTISKQLPNFPDSIPLLDQCWLLVVWSADFNNVGPMLAQHWLLVTSSARRWHNGGLPTTTQVRYPYMLRQWWIFIQDGGEQK